MSYEDVRMPENAPLPGFYYHYKHDPAKGEFDYAYELVGIGRHTEEDCRPEDRFLALYRPLDDTDALFKAGQLFDVRPLGMFTEMVTVNGSEMPRFTRVEDWPLIERLSKKRDEMYFL